MELSAYIIWNIFITLVLAPIWFQIKQNSGELRRQDILLNKTREEIAKGYVTKDELRNDMTIIMERMDKISEKLDKLFEVK
jgi:archaellum component FlaC